MTPEDPMDEFEEIDLGYIARYLGTLYPQFSQCELVKMVLAFAKQKTCTCSLCTPTKFPECQQDQGTA